MRIQSRVKGRRPVHSGVTKEINRRLDQTALRFNCSKSFVVNTMLAEALGIDTGETYYRPKEFSKVMEDNKVVSFRRRKNVR